MRRMRGFQWYHILLAVPVVILGFGIHYLTFKRAPASKGASSPLANLSAVLRLPEKKAEKKVEEKNNAPSQTHDVNPNQHPAGKQRLAETAPLQVGSVKEASVKEKVSHALPSSPSVVVPFLPGRSLAGENPKLKAAKPAVKEIQPVVAQQNHSHAPSSGSHAVPEKQGAVNASGDHSSCMSVEFRGAGPAVQTGSEDWERILDQYADVKHSMLEWLEKNRKGFPEKTAVFMERQVLSVKLLRPPVASEPDLAWRGIGVFGYDGQTPAIHLGSGFAKLAKEQPARAKFELARLLAQSFSPCELQREKTAIAAWKPLLQCLQVAEGEACASGSYSESGWAVSSTVAAVVSPPGCVVPAFKSPELARCVEKIPLPIQVSEPAHHAELKNLWKESRR